MFLCVYFGGFSTTFTIRQVKEELLNLDTEVSDDKFKIPNSLRREIVRNGTEDIDGIVAGNVVVDVDCEASSELVTCDSVDCVEDVGFFVCSSAWSSTWGFAVGWLYRDWETDRKSTRLNSSHRSLSRMPSSA